MAPRWSWRANWRKAKYHVYVWHIDRERSEQSCRACYTLAWLRRGIHQISIWERIHWRCWTLGGFTFRWHEREEQDRKRMSKIERGTSKKKREVIEERKNTPEKDKGHMVYLKRARSTMTTNDRAWPTWTTMKLCDRPRTKAGHIVDNHELGTVDREAEISQKSFKMMPHG